MPNVSKQNVVFNGPINFLRLKRGLFSKKRLPWNEMMMVEYHDFIEGPLDYRDPGCLNLYEFKLNSEGNYMLEQIEEKNMQVYNDGDALEENDDSSVFSTENETKTSVNKNVKTFFYFFHNLPNLFCKKKKNKFFLLKRASYSKKLKTKIFNFLRKETGPHPLTFFKTALSAYKFTFDTFEEEYLYSAFDKLRNLKTSLRENTVYLAIEGVFDEYKLNVLEDEGDKLEIINSEDDIAITEKFNTITSKEPFEYKKTVKVDLDSLPYNFKIIKVNEPKKVELKEEKKIIEDSELSDEDEKKKSESLNLEEGSVLEKNTSLKSKKKETNKKLIENDSLYDLDEEEEEDFKKNLLGDVLDENYSFKLDLLNEDWESVYDNYNFFLFKKHNFKVKKKEYVKFFFYNISSFTIINDFDFYTNENYTAKPKRDDLVFFNNENLFFEKLSLEDLNIDTPSIDTNNNSADLIKNYMQFLKSEPLTQAHVELLKNLNFSFENFNGEFFLSNEAEELLFYKNKIAEDYLNNLKKAIEEPFFKEEFNDEVINLKKELVIEKIDLKEKVVAKEVDLKEEDLVTEEVDLKEEDLVTEEVDLKEEDFVEFKYNPDIEIFPYDLKQNSSFDLDEFLINSGAKPIKKLEIKDFDVKKYDICELFVENNEFCFEDFNVEDLDFEYEQNIYLYDNKDSLKTVMNLYLDFEYESDSDFLSEAQSIQHTKDVERIEERKEERRRQEEKKRLENSFFDENLSVTEKILKKKKHAYSYDFYSENNKTKKETLNAESFNSITPLTNQEIDFFRKEESQHFNQYDHRLKSFSEKFEDFEKKDFGDFFLNFFNLNANLVVEDWFMDSIIENYFISFSSDFLYEKNSKANVFKQKKIFKNDYDMSDTFNAKFKEYSDDDLGSLFFIDNTNSSLDDLVGFKDSNDNIIEIRTNEIEDNKALDLTSLDNNKIEQVNSESVESPESDDADDKTKIKKIKKKNIFDIENDDPEDNNLKFYENNINDLFLNANNFWDPYTNDAVFEKKEIISEFTLELLFENSLLDTLVELKDKFDQIGDFYFDNNTAIFKGLKNKNNRVSFLQDEDNLNFDKNATVFDTILYSKNINNYEIEYQSADLFESSHLNFLSVFDFASSKLCFEKNNDVNFENNLIDKVFTDENFEDSFFSEEFFNNTDSKVSGDSFISNTSKNLVLKQSNLNSLFKDDLSFLDVEHNSSEFENQVFSKNFLPFFFLLKKLKNAFFLKSIFNFFFFFLPSSFFNFIYLTFNLEIKNLFFKNKNLLNGNLKNFENKVDFIDILYHYDPEFKTRNKNNNFCFFFFLSNFFSKKIKENVSISFASTAEIEDDFRFFFYKNFNEMSFFFKNQMIFFNYSDFFDIFFLCLKLKDLSSFAEFLKEFFEKIQIKFHKVFLKKFELFLFSFFNKFRKKFKIKGFLLDIRGKVSVVGNSKKRHILIKKGYLSKSKKKLKFFFYKNQINTNTGVLGATYILSY